MTNFVVVIFFIACIPQAAGKLGGKAPQGHTHDTARVGSEALQTALDDLLGSDADGKHVAATAEMLRPMWLTIPKDTSGKVEWSSLRYMAHRHFMHRFGLTVRGFEPARLLNASHTGHADVLHQHLPHFVEILLSAQDADAPRGFLGEQTTGGFTLKDAAALVVTIEHLIFNAETSLLEVTYDGARRSVHDRLSMPDLEKVLVQYLTRWLLGDDADIKHALKNPKVLDDVFPHWPAIREFAVGQVKALEFSRQAQSSMVNTYSFDDVHAVVGGITRSFASFWESECRTMKDALVDMDLGNTGRVPLSTFYGTALAEESRFGESEAYLRDLGVLDETSAWRGKEVRIANYMQAASNCLISAPNYLMCCKNECEDILGDIESAIRAPYAKPSEILDVVRNIYSPSGEEDVAPELDGILTAQLHKLSELHGGKVPLHGRLFSQWLHYVYPRECAFPHKAGQHITHSPNEYGGNYVASQAEMVKHSEGRAGKTAVSQDAAEEDSWISEQWSEEEEVLLAGSSVLRAPWSSNFSATTGGAMVAFMAAVWLAMTWRGNMEGSVLPTSSYDLGKCHSV